MTSFAPTLPENRSSKQNQRIKHFHFKFRLKVVSSWMALARSEWG